MTPLNIENISSADISLEKAFETQSNRATEQKQRRIQVKNRK
jgi:hypothetical protein